MVNLFTFDLWEMKLFFTGIFSLKKFILCSHSPHTREMSSQTVLFSLIIKLHIKEAPSMYLFIQNLLLNRKFFQFKKNFPALHPEERNQSQHLRKAEKVLLSLWLWDQNRVCCGHLIPCRSPYERTLQKNLIINPLAFQAIYNFLYYWRQSSKGKLCLPTSHSMTGGWKTSHGGLLPECADMC